MFERTCADQLVKAFYLPASWRKKALGRKLRGSELRPAFYATVDPQHKFRESPCLVRTKTNKIPQVDKDLDTPPDDVDEVSQRLGTESGSVIVFEVTVDSQLLEQKLEQMEKYLLHFRQRQPPVEIRAAGVGLVTESSHVVRSFLRSGAFPECTRMHHEGRFWFLYCHRDYENETLSLAPESADSVRELRLQLEQERKERILFQQQLKQELQGVIQQLLDKNREEDRQWLKQQMAALLNLIREPPQQQNSSEQ